MSFAMRCLFAPNESGNASGRQELLKRKCHGCGELVCNWGTFSPPDELAKVVLVPLQLSHPAQDKLRGGGLATKGGVIEATEGRAQVGCDTVPIVRSLLKT